MFQILNRISRCLPEPLLVINEHLFYNNQQPCEPIFLGIAVPFSSIQPPFNIPSIPAGIRSSKIYGFNLNNKNPELASAYPWYVFAPPFEEQEFLSSIVHSDTYVS